MTASTWTWIGLTDTVDDSSNWSLTSGPGNSGNRPESGDTAVFSGAGVAPQFVDQQLSNNNTLDLTGTGTVQFLNDTASFNTSIGQSITIDASGTATSILTEGTFTNGGTVQINGAGNHLTIDVAADITNGATHTGWFENDGSIVVNQGATLTVTATAGATFAGFGTVFVDGGSALVDAALPTFTNDANFSISQSGSLEITQAGTSAAPNISFNGPGVLKIDQPQEWVFNGGNAAGTINGFVAGDTINLGILNVTSVVYDNNGDIILIGTNGGTVFAAQANSGALSSNGPGTFALTGTGGIAGDVVVTEGSSADTLLTVAPPRTWLWTNGASASAESNNWTVVAGPAGTGGPNQGDTAINAGGTILEGNSFNLKSNTLELGGTASLAAIIPGGATGGGGGNGPASYMNPSIDSNSVITNVVTSVGTFAGNTTAETSLFGVAGPFVNEGSIIAAGPAGSSFTITVNDTSVNGTLQAGSFINYKNMEVGPGNAMTIEVGPGSEFFNPSEILVNGGTLKFVADPNAIDGGYAGEVGAVVIVGGGTVETNSTYSPLSTSTLPVYAFADSTDGNTLKIDNIQSFGGAIIGFGQGDTIDLGTLIATDAIAYSRNTGILNFLDNGTIVDSLVLGSGNFQSGTTSISGGIAGGFTIATGTDGDTVLTTAAQNDVFNNTSGSWQSSGLWSNGTPGSLDTALIGFGSTSNFTLTTGTAPVSLGAPIMVGGLVQITSTTSFGPFAIRQFGGSLEVTGGNTLTGSQLYIGGGSTTIDPAGTLDLYGHAVYGSTGAVGGTIVAIASNPRALAIGSGALLVNGGVVNAGTGQASGGGGSSEIGIDGGGTPATLTVQSNGATAGVVTDLYTDIASDPTGFGLLTLNGNGTAGGASWTDQIDPNETGSLTTGFMLVGYNNQSTLTGTVTPPPFSAAATLVVENGATLTEQSYAIIGQSEDSAGSAQVAGGLWNIGTGPQGGFLNVGDSATSTGSLEVDSGGTVALGHGGTFVNEGTSFDGSGINVGLSAQSTGSVTVQNGGLITDGAGLLVGDSGQGTVAVLNGGTIQLTGTSGIAVGNSAGGAGSLLVSGTGNSPAVISFNATAKGISDGAAGQGTVDVESGGTIQMNGTGGFAVGQSANAIGFAIIEGANATVNEGVTGNGMPIAAGASSSGTVIVQNGGSIVLNGTSSSAGIGIGQASGAQGTLDIEGGGTVQVAGHGNINVGQSSGATGLIIVNGGGALLNEGTASAGLGVGQSGSGTLEVENAGTVSINSTTAGLRVGQNGDGLVEVSGPNALLALNTPNNPATVGISASGTLTVAFGGTVTLDNTLGIGFATGGTGLVSVSDSGSTLSVSGPNGAIDVGSPGTGTLNVSDGGNASASAVFVATGSAVSRGTITVNGGTLTDNGGLTVGNNGTGTLNVESGGLVQLNGSNGVNVGFNTGASGVVTVTGGTLSNSGGFFAISNTGANGALTVGAGGSVIGGSLTENGGGTVSVSGAGAQISTSNGLIIGAGSGSAAMTIAAGGTVSNSSSFNGTQIGSGASGDSGTVTVNSGGTLTGDALGVGTGGTGVLTVNTGGQVATTGGNGVNLGGFGVGGSGSVTVNGGTLSDSGDFTIGNTNASGTLLVEGAGELTSNAANGSDFAGGITASGSGTAAAAVTGGSTWSVNGQLNIGGGGSGSLDINSSGTVNAATNTISIGGGTVGGGTVSVESLGSLTAGFIGIANSGSNVGSTALLSVAGGAVAAGSINEGQGGTIAVSSGSLAVSGPVSIGQNGTGAVLTQSGGVVSTGALTLAQSIGASGLATVSGGTLTATGLLDVGQQGSGVVTIDTGASVVADDGLTLDGGGGPGRGSLVISGGALTEIGGVTLGKGGAASVLVSAGGSLSASASGVSVTQFDVGSASGGSASLTVSGGQLATTNEALFIGDGGNGALLVENAGVVSTSSSATGPLVDVNATGGAEASAQVSGAGSRWNLTSSGAQFIVGDTGDGSVSVSSDGVINAGVNAVDVGNQAQGAGTITVTSGGTMSATAGPSQASAFDVGAAANATGAITVTGLGSRVNATGQITVGDSGIGDLLITAQATVQSGGAVGAPTQGIVIGQTSGGSGVITVAGTQSVLTNSGQFIVGNSGLGSLSIAAGGSVTTTTGASGGPTGLEIAANASAAGSGVDVSGAGSGLTVTGMLDVGDNGSGSLSLSQGATVTAGSLDAANVAAAVGQISLSGAGTRLLITNAATVADDGTGVLSVLSGATFSAASLTIGSQGDSSGAVVVSGSGSQLNLTGALNIGTANGTGDLTVGPGAAIQAQAVIQQGQVVLEGGLLDPTVQLINQGQTAGGFGTIAAGDIVDEGAIQAGGNKGSQKLLIVQGTVLGGGTLTVNGTQPGSVPAGILQINAGGTLELSGAVLNAATTTFTDNLTPQGTYTVNNSVIDVNFVDDAGVLLLDDIAGFAGTITTYQAGDKFVITGGTLSGVIVSNGDTLLVSDSGANAGPDGIDSIIFNAPVNPLGFKVVNGNTVEAQALPCFAAGTRIETERGLVAVEDLHVGDRVMLAGDRAPEPIVWIGQRTVNCRVHPKPENVWPVRVRAGALGRNVPARDVYLSPDHAVFVNGVLVPVKLLINGTSVAQVERAAVTYYHVELPGHAIILAEGLPVESYLHTGDRSDFRGGETMRLFPDFSARLAPETALLWETSGAAELVLSGPALEAARRMVGDGDASGASASLSPRRRYAVGSRSAADWGP